MAEYINKKELEEAFDNADPDVCENYTDGHSDWGFGRENVRDVIRGVPAADVAPVVHGRWVDEEPNFTHGCYRHSAHYQCSVCGRRTGKAQTRNYRYCPKCGARMDGDA